MQRRTTVFNFGKTLCHLAGWAAVCVMTVCSIWAQTAEVDGLRRKAESGNSKAAYDLAKVYFEGKLVAVDPQQGLAWLQRAASQGYPGAEVALGYFYQKGFKGPHGVRIKEDPHKAAEWYRKAASQPKTNATDGSSENARANLAKMLAQGQISAQEADWHVGEQPSSQPKPAKSNKVPAFSLTEVETGLTGGITSKRMSTLVTTYGVDFSLSAGAKKRLTDEGADDNLLQTIASSKH
ncbi:MAG TPA: tetratricopeptide repeat protein [Candidatus Dormibacteraeota bacterium]|nr:tetratricopeptide repeat protein [Candidatus Dormibacteraeota bacterium]